MHYAMFIRWQSRQRRRAQFGRSFNDTHWRAVLVESVRIDGKPRHRHIAYLAGFTESAARVPAQQCLVWEHIEKRLKRLGKRITEKDRKAIMAALIEKLGKPPTKAQRVKLDREQTNSRRRGDP
jgi:hypothetical protein